ncbi:hypothetical protein ACJRO7_012235, partial [Eucalyptus globulus]
KHAHFRSCDDEERKEKKSSASDIPVMTAIVSLKKRGFGVDKMRGIINSIGR